MAAGVDVPAKPLIVHGTCIAVAKRAVLFRGASGAGKSDLALRCLAAPPLSSMSQGGAGSSANRSRANAGAAGAAVMVSDDQVELRRVGTRILARSPTSIAGKLEVRGLGIFELEHVSEAELVLVFDLAMDLAAKLPDRGAIERMPEISAPSVSQAAADGPAQQRRTGGRSLTSEPIARSRDPCHPLRTATYLGVKICRLTIAPFEASAPLKVLLALQRVTEQTRT